MKILIVKTSSLGDIIHSYPVLSYLKKRFPECSIDFVVEKSNAELVLSHPFVNHVIEVDTKSIKKGFFSFFKGILNFRKKIQQKTYDVCFDLQGNIKSGVIVSFVKAKDKVGFGFKTVPEWPNCLFNSIRFNPKKGCNIRKDYLHLVASYFKDEEVSVDGEAIVLSIIETERQKIENILNSPIIENRFKVMVSPGSIWKNKQLRVETLVDFLQKLKMKNEKTIFLFTWGSIKEKQEVEELLSYFPDSIVIDKLRLPVLQNLMANMDLVVAMDSLPLHLAGTTNVSTYSFFGPSLGKKYAPVGTEHQFFQGVCPYGKVFDKRCPVLRTCKTGACLRG